MPDNIPDWAIEKAVSLANAAYRAPFWRTVDVRHNAALTAFAGYISEHEEAPVDPIEHEAQQIADDIGLNLSAMPRVERALQTALRRGIELASTNATDDGAVG